MPIQSTRVLFETLFARTDKKTQERLLANKKSVLDGSLEEAKSLMARVSGRDKQRLEEYFAALRESEQELNKSLRWLNRPRQDVEFPVAPSFENNFLATDVDKKRFLENPRQIQRGIAFDMIYKAFKFDVTRVVNFYMVGLDNDHHLTTHNVPKSEEARTSLTKYDSSFFSLMANFYDKLSSTKSESGKTLMDETITVSTGNNSVSQKMGPHNGNEIPVYVAGGNFSNHGSHVVRQGETTCDIYLSILQKFGIERERFGNSRSSSICRIMLNFRFTKIAALLLLIDGARVSDCFADDRGQSQQFFNTYCISCHGKEKSKGGLRLHQFGEQQWNDPSLLNEIYQVIEFGEMPPEDAKKLQNLIR